MVHYKDDYLSEFRAEETNKKKKTIPGKSQVKINKAE